MAVPEPNLSQRRIDTHHHIVPPAYRDWLRAQGLDAGGRAIPIWTPEGSLAVMERNGSATAILSVSTPGVHLGDAAEARRMARAVNDYAAEVVQRHPGCFGFFATLTLPDLEGAIAEARYALDQLGADGVVLLSNVNGTYLGDPAWDPLMAELNSRAAVLFEHPSAPPGPAIAGIPAYAADFLLDTTRSAINLARQGCLERYPDLRIVLSHGGGFIPYAAERIAASCEPDGDMAAGLARLRRSITTPPSAERAPCPRCWPLPIPAGSPLAATGPLPPPKPPCPWPPPSMPIQSTPQLASGWPAAMPKPCSPGWRAPEPKGAAPH